MTQNKLLSIGYLFKKWLIFLSVAVLALFSSSVLAQESSPSGVFSQVEKPFVDDNEDGINDLDQRIGDYADPNIRAKIYGVEFPIADLGSCGSYFECRSFCEDPVNGEACVSYGKARGFYKDDPVILEKDKILSEAGRRLGCDSYESCLNFCEIPANYDKCNSFAKSQGIVGGVIDDPGSREIITKAKEALGCDSADSCQAFCLQQDNVSRCKSFAEEVGMRGGEHRVGPGGCQSEGTCRTFCSDPNNFEVCNGFTQVSGGTFTGPGGCNSADSCFTYCQENPTNCGYKEGEDPGKGIAPGGGYYNPVEMCNRTPNCSWAGNSCSCGYYGETKETVQKAQEYGSYCSANPDKCQPGRPAIFGAPEQRAEFEDFCRTSPDKCRPPTEQASEVSYGRFGGYYYGSVARPDPAAECGRYGCSWTGSSCQCSAANVGTYTPPAFTERNPESSCTAGGCKWTGSGCDCSSVSQDSPALSCGRRAGCSWINSSCQCQATDNQSQNGMYVPTYMPAYAPGAGSQGGYSGNPAADCGRAPNCSWTGSSCQCSSPGGGTTTYTPQSGYSGSGGSYTGSGTYSGSESYRSGGQPGGPGAPYPGKSSSGGGAYGGAYDASGKYVGGSYGGYDSAGNYVGTGSQSGSGGSSSGSYNQPYSGSYTQPSGGNYQQPYSGSGSYNQPYSGTYTPSSGSYTQPYSGSNTPSSGSYTAPSSGGSYTPPSSGSYTPPSSGSYTPPSSGDSGGSSTSTAPSSGDSGGSSTPSAPSSGDSGSSTPSAPSGGDSGGSSTPSAPSGGDSGGSAPAPAPAAPTVQGIYAVRGLIQTLLDFLQGE